MAFAEIEPFPCAVLAHHYPDVPNIGDITKATNWRQYRGAVDLVVAGTPCQDFSVAGKRAGLAGERSKLAINVVRLLHDIQPRWFIWENVPGVFSTNGGRNFGTFLRTLDDIGYSCAWRVLDAQYFGVPQRRRRVYVVGHLGDWRRAAAVLFDTGCMCRDTPKSQKKGKGADITQALTGRLEDCGPDDNKAQGNFYIPNIVSQAMTSKWSKGTSGPSGDEHHNLIVAFHGSQDPDVSNGITHPLGRNQGLETCLMENRGVRRLTPLECERLMGFPDDYTKILFRGKPAADSHRYKALGNSMVINVIQWIGKRITDRKR